MSITQLIGTVGSDPQTFAAKVKGEASTVTKFRLAVQPDRNGDTTWYSVAVFGDKQETVKQELSKGMKVAVEGPVNVREYEGKEYTDIIANGIARVQWLGGTRTVREHSPELPF